MKIIASFLTLAFLVLATVFIFQLTLADYQFEKRFKYAWNLADKSSTIEKKAEFIAEFVQTIEKKRSEFAEYNASWLTTPDNSFAANLDALRTLNTRLAEIRTMDPRSFEYQSAIKQITEQEQGEASQMLSVLYGCWVKGRYTMAWSWHAVLWVFGLILSAISLVVFWMLALDR